MSDVYKNLFSLTEIGDSNTSFWRTSLLENIFASKVLTSPLRQANIENVDRLYCDESAIRAFRMITKFIPLDSHKTYCMSLIPLDGIMTSIVDCFRLADSSFSAYEFGSSNHTEMPEVTVLS